MLYIPKRIIFVVLAFFGMLIIIAVRASMSIAIVAMVNRTTENPLIGTHIVDGCPNHWSNETQAVEKDFKGDKYNWNSATQGLILGAFYYGYTVTQLPSGVLCDKLGSKWLFGGGVLISTALYLLIPIAATWGPAAVVSIRILEGLGEGFTLPAVIHAISKWSPKFERSRMSTAIYMGYQLGTIVGSPIAGYLCGSDLFGGWPSTFYLFGTIGCVWFILWVIFTYEDPESHPTISKGELVHIQKNRTEKPSMDTPIPWKDIFLSLPMWSVIIANFAQDYTLFLLITMIPTYFKTILHFDIQKNGFISGLPFAFQATCALLASYVADKLRESNRMGVTTIRKASNTICFFGPAFCCLGITLTHCNPNLVVALLWIAVGLNGFALSGYNVTHIDMSPEYAGILYGITNTIGNFGSFFCPLMANLLTTNWETVENWNKIFYLTAGVDISCGLFFIFFASAELQLWGQTTKKEPQKIEQIFFVEATS